MYYLIRNNLTECNPAELTKTDTQFVAVLRADEWEAKKDLFDMGIDMDLNPADIHSTKIEVNYDYGVGKDNQINDHHNEFKLSFEPYEIVFTRVSDHDNETMNEIEETVKRKMNEFLYYETIFGD